MLYNITVKDTAGVGLAGATILIAAQDGNGSGSLVTDAAGKAVLNTGVDPFYDLEGVPVYFTVSKSGYDTFTVAPINNILRDMNFILDKAKSVLPYVLGGGIAAAALLHFSKKKKVSGFNFKNDALPYVVPAAVIIGGLLVYNKIFGKSAQDAARDNSLATDIAAAGAPTMSATEIAATANQIKEDLGYSWVSNDTTDAVRQLCKPKNLADVLLLIQAYGSHIITTFGIPRGTFTLEETVTSQLGQSDIDFVNEYYSAQGINFKF